MDSITVAEADSTTSPYSSPLRRSSSVWSIDTVPNLWAADGVDMEPDSTTGSGDTTPERLSPNLLDGYMGDDNIGERGPSPGPNNEWARLWDYRDEVEEVEVVEPRANLWAMLEEFQHIGAELNNMLVQAQEQENFAENMQEVARAWRERNE